MAPVLERGEEHEQIGCSFPAIFVIIAFWLSGDHWDRLAFFAHQVNGGLVETYYKEFRGGRALVNVQYILRTRSVPDLNMFSISAFSSALKLTTYLLTMPVSFLETDYHQFTYQSMCNKLLVEPYRIDTVKKSAVVMTCPKNIYQLLC
jgi:hypothetical protein